ncbi:nose resistant to fluoxetine protein 6-like [Topomyia yanbarensis]|uniref:nose resistant to fluoxetine protein 6-like n=1 Tax=Topomyia yanbarensis TaxID=2498891 RepID=UPI00273BE7CB|nr:nose resistant to fluoxetine protein 6-like [Topomyia yanbarensis]
MARSVEVIFTTSVGGVRTISAIVLTLLCFSSVVRCSDSEKSGDVRLPPMYHFENKNRCLSDDPSNIYCVARTIVKPDNSSNVWKIIKENSIEDTQYRHYLLDRGFCIKTCTKLVNGLTEDQKRFFDQKKFYVETPYIYDATFIPGMENYKRDYGRTTNICLGYQLQRDYNLSSYSEIEHCTTSDTFNKPITVFHVLFAVSIGAIILLVLRATFRDNRVVRNLNNNHVTVEDSSSSPENDIWMEFSLNRSFRRLLAEPRTKLQRDLAFMESVRVLSVFFISTLHTTMAFGASPMANPEQLEALFSNAVVRTASAVFPFLVHTFFTIGGMLLAVHFLDFIETGPKFRWSIFFGGVMNRYLRMLPAYLIMWLYQVSWLDRIGNGPTAHRLVDVEMHFCKKNGWTNFLFINNYYKYNEACMQQTWYMAADFQFFFIGMIIMMLLWRFPKSSKVAIATMMTVSVVAPIINNYVFNFVGVILLNFKHLRFMLFHYEWMQRDYVLAHPHTCSYFSGIIAGIAYHRAQKDPKYLGKLTIYKHLKRIAPLMVLLMSAPATFFYGIHPSSPSLWMAIYASAHRNFFGIMCGVGLLYGATDGSSKIPSIFRHRVVLAIGRLSFCVYLAQFNAIRFYFLNVSENGFVVNVHNFINACLVVFGLSYGAGLLLCTMVELPVAAVIKRLQGASKSSKESIKTETEINGNGKIKYT